MIKHASTDTNRVLAALGLIMLGLMFFMGIGLLWPLFILVPGAVMLALASNSKVAAAALAIPGALLAGLGGLMFVQNLTGYWASWAYAWTLIPAFVGLGFHVMARGMDEPELRGLARWLVKGGLIAFGVLGVFFEFMIGLGGIGSGGAALLILVGLFILGGAFSDKARLPGERSGRAGNAKRKNEDVLFTGPLVVGSRGRREVSRLALDDDALDTADRSARR